MKFVVYIALSLLTMYITKQLDNSMDTYYSTITYPHVYDVFHSALPNFHKYEYILNIYSCVFILAFLIPSIFTEFIGYIVPIFILKLIFNHATILPKHYECNVSNDLNPYGGCYDKIFSGHFAFVFLITLLLWNHKLIPMELLVLFNTIHAFLILVTRAHYTIDILVSALVTLYIVQNKLSL